MVGCETIAKCKWIRDTVEREKEGGGERKTDEYYRHR